MPEPPDQETLDKLIGVQSGANTEVLLAGYSGSFHGLVVIPPTTVRGGWVAIDVRNPQDPWLTVLDAHGGEHGMLWSHIVGLTVDLKHGQTAT